MICRLALGLVFGLVFGLTPLGCGDPGVTACIARCQTFTVDPTVCQTVCTRTCAELRASFGIDEDACRRIQNGTVNRATAESPLAAPAPDLTARCADFVAFAFSCGIGRPPPDLTVDIGVQRNNEIVIQGGVTAQCERRQPPYDDALIRCFESSAPDCARYKTCADAAVSARAPRP